jgi:hypothetical protein
VTGDELPTGRSYRSREPTNHISEPSCLSTALESPEWVHDEKLREIFIAFNEAWIKYWDSYINLQDKLYESLRAGREVSWLAATDERKMTEINQVQRELFQNMPRRLDYSPVGQISQDMDSATTKIKDLEAVLTLEEGGCRRLEAAIALMKEKVGAMQEALRSVGPSDTE